MLIGFFYSEILFFNKEFKEFVMMLNMKNL